MHCVPPLQHEQKGDSAVLIVYLHKPCSVKDNHESFPVRIDHAHERFYPHDFYAHCNRLLYVPVGPTHVHSNVQKGYWGLTGMLKRPTFIEHEAPRCKNHVLITPRHLQE